MIESKNSRLLRQRQNVALKGAFFLLFFLCLLGFPGCASQTPKAGPAEAVPPEWTDLRDRLAADGTSGPEVDALLAGLGSRTQDPMGRKMVELYRKNFLPRPPSKREPRDAVYRNVVTEKNAGLCRDYIAAHRKAFDEAERTWGVPPAVAAALLFVETRLGTVLKDVPENALHTLASMSQSVTTESIPDWLEKMPGWEEHRDWFATVMPARAEWAYKETRALIRYMLANGIRPDMLPGSIYGAIGLCQFMPSNIPLYGVDGNGDGSVNLYDAEDAVPSLACFLARHGWRPGAARKARHAALMRYNKSVKYANTILALADLVQGRPAEPVKAGRAGAR